MLSLKSKQKLVSKLMKVDIGEVEENAVELEELNALHYSTPNKDGGSIIVGADGSVLFANSSVSFAMHLRDFKNGKRTPLESFEIAEGIDDKIVADITRLKKGSRFVMADYFEKYGVKKREMTKLNKVVREKLAHLGVVLDTPKEFKGAVVGLAYNIPTIKK